MPDTAASRKRQNCDPRLLSSEGRPEPGSAPDPATTVSSLYMYVCKRLLARGSPDPPMRGRDQDRLVGPNVEPHAGSASARKAQGLDTGLVEPPEFQIALIRGDLNRQPMAR